MMNQPPLIDKLAARRGLLVIWVAQLLALGVLFVLTRVVHVAYSPGGDDLRFRVLDVLGGAAFALSFVAKHLLLRRAFVLRRADYVTTAYVLAFALCEMAAICGLLNYFISGMPIYLLFLLALTGLLLHFPRRAHLAAVAPADAPGAGFNSTLG